MVWRFNSSNTAREAAAVISKAASAEKWRFWPAGISESSTTLPSARMRTRVAAEVETERFRAAEFARGGGPAGDGRGCAAPSGCEVTAGDCEAWRYAE